MKFNSVIVFFISALLIGQVYGGFWDYTEEEDITDPLDLDSPNPESSDEYYTPYYFHLGNGEEGNVNTEENEIGTEEDRPDPNLETAPSEDEDFIPQQEPATPSLESIAEKVEQLLTVFKAQQDKISELEVANKRLILKIDSIEQMAKTNSVILTNVHQDPKETSKITLQRVLHVFNKIMRVRTSARDIAVALRAESNLSEVRNKPIVVRFTNFATKMKVLASSHRLSHTDISVSSDYSELVAQKRAALVPYLQQARTEGLRAFILYDRLVVDGVKLTLEELRAQHQPEEENKSPDRQVELLNTDCK